MDTMMIRIIEMVTNQPGISFDRLMHEFGLSKTQLQYRIKKINGALETEGLPSIIKEEQRLFLKVEEKKKALFLEKQSSFVHLQSQERQTYIILMIILYENQTLASLGELLGVSRNTILADMKEVERRLKEHHLSLIYSRQRGYCLIGEELMIRKMWFFLIREETERSDSAFVLKALLRISGQLLEEIHHKIELLETELQLSFSEAKLTYLSMIIYLSILRSSHSFRINVEKIDSYGSVLSEETYRIVEKLFVPFYEQDPDLIEEELQFVTMHILSINVVKKTSFKKVESLNDAIDKAINNFERASITLFEKREELRDILYQHIIPASYRIRFGVPDKNNISESIKKEYQEFYAIVKNAIRPIEENLNIEFLEDELAYLLIIFLGFLKSDQKETAKKTAVVVCMQGVSVSRLLLENLKELLPNIHFKRYLSLREFYELKLEVDMVFSTVGIDTDLPTFFIKHFLSDDEKKELKRSVEQNIFGQISMSHSQNSLKTEEFVEIVKAYATIHDETALKKSFDALLEMRENQEKSVQFVSREQNSLRKLLPQEHIQIYDNQLSFEGAIQMAAKPLVRKGFIEDRYVEKIISTYDPSYPYFVIAPQVAIPHAGPGDGVKKLGMSLLKMKHAIPFSEKLAVNIIVIIAPKDKKTHLNAFTQLYNLVNNTEFRSKLLTARYERDIYELLKNVPVEKGV